MEKNRYDRIYITVPALNPDDRLISLCESLLSMGVNNICIVDDGSDLSHKGIFSKLESCCTVIHHETNKGKGAALRSAMNYLKGKDVLGCVTADCDGQHRPEDIKEVADVFLKHPESLVLGFRDFDKKRIPFKSLIGNKLTKSVFRKICGIDLKDTQTGLRGIPKEFFSELLQLEGYDRFEFETKMLMMWGTRPILEVPVKTVYENGRNDGTHFRPFSDSIRIYRVLLSGQSYGKNK